MPPGDDPADSVAKTGAEGFHALVEKAVPLLEFVLKREAARYSVGDAEVQARALTSGLRLLAKTENSGSTLTRLQKSEFPKKKDALTKNTRRKPTSRTLSEGGLPSR